MRIELITQEQYDLLLEIQAASPILTFQNVGYEYIDRSKFSAIDIVNCELVTEILKKAVLGFSKFNNFLHSKEGVLKIRFQYCWTADEINPSTPFTGVGYLELEELLKGFKK